MRNRYVFTTEIAARRGDRVYAGMGEYLLTPKFIENRLVLLEVTAFERWDGGSISNRPNWLNERIDENYSVLDNRSFRRVLAQSRLGVSENGRFWERGNTVIYQNFISTIYIDRRELYEQLLEWLTNAEKAESRSESLIF